MRLFIISLLLTFSEYNFYKTPPIFKFIYSNNNATTSIIVQKSEQYDPSIVSLVTVANILILNRMDIVYSANIYNIKMLMYLMGDDIFYINKNVEFTRNVCIVLIALNIL